MPGLLIYKVLHMYYVEKRCTVLKNVAGFMRYVCIHGLITKWWHFGMFIHCESKLRIPPNTV